MHAANDGSTATIGGIVRRARLMHPVSDGSPRAPEPKRAVEPLRTLSILGDNEPRGHRFLWIAMLAIVLALYAMMLANFWAPADAGIDQNAYLLGGKSLAKTFSTRYVTISPFQYVGGMFVINSKGDFYPKYPLGLPLLFATMYWIFGAAKGAIMAFAISPAGAVLAVAGMFFLARALAGSFAAILCAILLATSQVMLELANNPNSHASCAAFVVWGMLLLVRWWQTGSSWRGLLAGFLLGYACLIRYTEGLLVIPIAIAAICAIRWKSFGSYVRAAMPMLGWLAPVAFLLIYNKATLGEWTGYDSTNESEVGKAFTLQNFRDNWELTLRTFYDQGLFFVLPLGIAGLVMLFRRSWRAGLLILAWLLPATALYTSYYWSMDRGVAFARFFLTLFPAALVGFAICVRYGILATSNKEIGGRSVALPLAAGLIVAIASGVATWRAIGGAEEGGRGGMSASLVQQHYTRTMLAQLGSILRKHAPPGSILFAEDARGPEGALNYLPIAGDWDVFTVSAFSMQQGNRMMRGGGGGPMMQNQDNPSPMQPRRRLATADLYRGKTSRDLSQEQGKVVDDALKQGREVFIVGNASTLSAFRQNLPSPKKYDFVTVDRWKDAPPPSGAEVNRMLMDRGPNRRGFGGNFGPGPGRGGFGGPGMGPPGGAMFMGGPIPPGEMNNSGSWELVEVKLKPPAPTTLPVAQR